MRRFYYNNIFLIIALPVLLIALLWELMSWRSLEPDYESKRIYGILAQKEKVMEDEMGEIIARIKNTRSLASAWYLLNPDKYKKNDISFSISKYNTIIYWTSSLTAFPQDDSGKRFTEGLVHLPTGWYYMHARTEGVYTFRGFILIKREFPYRNKYIQDGFQKEFNLPDDYLVRQENVVGAINVTRPGGDFIFCIIPIQGAMNQNNINTIVFLYFVLLILFLSQINLWLEKSHWLRPLNKFLISFGIGVLTYIFINRFKLPNMLYQSDLFSPGEFAYGSWLSSPGEFLILSVLLFYAAQSFFSLFRLEFNPEKNFRSILILVFIFAALYFSFSVFLLKILLLNSNISLEFFSDLQLSFINIVSFFCVSLLSLGLILIIIRIRAEYFIFLRYKKMIFYFLGGGFLSFILLSLSGNSDRITPFGYFILISILILFTQPEQLKSMKFTFLLFIAIISATYLNIFSHQQTINKKDKVQQLLAVNLSSERDPAAEIFLSELDDKFSQDTIVERYLFPPIDSITNKSVEAYFRNNYFTGFWRNYDLKVTICSPVDSILVMDVNAKYPCFDFYNEMEVLNGLMIPGSNFYYMKQLNGRIYYLGQLDYNLLKIFIELTSKIIPEGSGYPELLLDERTSRESRYEGFSYAKYFEGKLVDRGGDYQYEMQPPKEAVGEAEFQFFYKNGYKHCSFHIGENNYIIVSYAKPDLTDQVKTFPYLFLMIYLVGLMIILLNQPSFRVKRKPLDFRGKIQLTLILSLLATTSLVGLGLIIYNYEQFKASLQQDFREKLHAISTDLSMRIGPASGLNFKIHDMITDQLISLSDITRTDINLYDRDGQLYATSRSEIYERGLNSSRINPAAFHAMMVESRSQYMHNENFGMMSFFSTYIPFYSSSNNLLGYLNLPYFTRQDEFKKDVSAFIVAFFNVYILLILISLIVALFISNKLTLPLLKIEKNLKGIQLGKVNAKIEYLGEDEIGRLAKEYNKKVDELAESAAQLARTERELAWREMARQIAHEINNPLTPMKLNIQYLRRIKEQGIENFDEYFDQVSRTLIENIDVLSSIASSFSDFARMPKIQNELIELRERVNEAAQLFKNTPNVSIEVIVYDNQPLQIVGDKDQLNRVLINIIKNGIQSVPRDREGHITIEMKKDNGHALITIKDNGSGIPEELQSKLFEPSFTTKSSGMGLGLAIAKRIIENFKGEIWFQTKDNEGTTFFIKIPLAQDN